MSFSSAIDKTNNELVAIKKIENAFSRLVDIKRTYREIKLLRNLDHQNLLEISDILPPQEGKLNWKDM